ncbi:hypothetical protein Droror1_Dr00012692 [Drosera rotundifolia]
MIILSIIVGLIYDTRVICRASMLESPGVQLSFLLSNSMSFWRVKRGRNHQSTVAFVTSAYKRKLAKRAKWLEEERLRELREEKDEVSKKTDISDFYFNLSKNVAFGATNTKLQMDKKPERGHSPAVSPGTLPSRSQERSQNEEVSRVQVDTSSKQVEGPVATSVPRSKETEKPTSSDQPKSDKKKNRNADGSFEFVVSTTQHSLRDANNPAGLLSIAEETLAEFLSKATETAVDWVQMSGMKVADFCMKLTTKGVIPATYAFVS